MRYVYGLTQELSETLEKIDGVLVARVHIVQPERDPLMRQVTAPSASVMIRYRSDYNLEYMRDKIRALVAGSVEGLTPDHVYLTLIPVTPVADRRCDAKGDADARFAPSAPGSRRSLVLTTIAMTVMVMLLIVSAWVWDSGIRSFTPTFFRRRKLKPGAGAAEPGATQRSARRSRRWRRIMSSFPSSRSSKWAHYSWLPRGERALSERAQADANAESARALPPLTSGVRSRRCLRSPHCRGRRARRFACGRGARLRALAAQSGQRGLRAEMFASLVAPQVLSAIQRNARPGFVTSMWARR